MKHEEEERSFIKQHRGKLLGGMIGLGLIVAGVSMGSGKGSSPRREPARIMTITLPLPTPQPPPQPLPRIPPPPAPEQKMVEQTPVTPDEKPPVDVPKDEPPVALGTNIKGGEGDRFGLSGSGNGGGYGSKRPSGGVGSRFGWYAGKVQSRIGEAMRNHRKMRTAGMRIEVRIWPDSTGRVTRAQLVGSTGDSALDAVLRNEILQDLQLPEPPPVGMPLPIVLRLTAKRPS